MSVDDIDVKTEIVDLDYQGIVRDKQNEFDNCDDVSYLAREIRQREALSEDDVKRLRYLQVQLQHEVPPQHKVEKHSGTHAPTQEELEQFKAIVPLKKGSFSSVEDDIIVHNWKKFCKLHKWNKHKYKAFLCLRNTDGWKYICRKKEIRKFVQFLANNLPNRTLYSVYHRFKNLFSKHIQRRYTKEEDIMILNHIDHNPKLNERRKFADLAQVLNRSRASVWQHYRLLKRKQQLETEN